MSWNDSMQIPVENSSSRQGGNLWDKYANMSPDGNPAVLFFILQTTFQIVFYVLSAVANEEETFK